MSRAAFAQKTHEQNVDFFINWLSDITRPPIDVRQGLEDILSNNNSFYALKEMQLWHVVNQLVKSYDFGDGLVKLDDIITLSFNINPPGIFGASIQSRPQFVKLIYQYISCFPTALYDAYKEITGAALRLDDLSEIREFYEHGSKFDLWTAHEFCAYISHCDPEALDFISENPENLNFMSQDIKAQRFIIGNLPCLLPKQFSHVLLRPDLYEQNLPLVQAAILGGAFELVHFNHDNWEQSSLNPQKGLEWAKKKGIEYHPVLDELLLGLEPAPAIVAPAISESTIAVTDILSGYTTPY